VTLHDIDVAHSGAFSLYLDGIHRSDTICAELWRTIQSDPEYRDKTNLLILPDFGRDSNLDAGGNGFQHHRTGDALSRTAWMIALGPDIKQNSIVDRRIESIDRTPSVAALLGCDAPMAHDKLIAELGL
jgi:arylsulfatase A-like enzyme